VRGSTLSAARRRLSASDRILKRLEDSAIEEEEVEEEVDWSIISSSIIEGGGGGVEVGMTCSNC